MTKISSGSPLFHKIVGPIVMYGLLAVFTSLRLTSQRGWDVSDFF